jgi:hypothetical protein
VSPHSIQNIIVTHQEVLALVGVAVNTGFTPYEFATVLYKNYRIAGF